MPDADDPPLFRVMNEIGIINQLATTRAERMLPAGLTLAQFTVLNHFVRLGGERAPAELARAFQVTKQTMTSTLARLARAGLVSIRPDPADGRAKRVAITPRGREVRESAVAAMARAFADADRLLPADELARLLPLLVALRQRLDSSR